MPSRLLVESPSNAPAGISSSPDKVSSGAVARLLPALEPRAPRSPEILSSSRVEDPGDALPVFRLDCGGDGPRLVLAELGEPSSGRRGVDDARRVVYRLAVPDEVQNYRPSSAQASADPMDSRPVDSNPTAT